MAENEEYKNSVNDESDNHEARMYAAKKKGVATGIIISLLVIIVLLLLIGPGVGVFLGTKSFYTKKPQVTSAFLASKHEDASDLTTARLSYPGVIHYDDGGIPFLTQKKYSMVYSAEMEAGIDLSGVEIEVTDDTVKVKLPDVEVEDPVVDMDSIDFYDDSFALFDWETKEDGIDAVKEAEKDCKEKADIASLESEAYENAKKIVEELLKDAVLFTETIIEICG